MSRVEKFRQVRSLRRKCMLLLFLFFLLVTSGICISDYSVNYLMKDKKSIEIVSIKNINNSYIEIALMNYKAYLNITYINRDFQRVRKVLRL